MGVSDVKFTSYPPSVQPGFMGAQAQLGTRTSERSYFQNYRNEVISRMQVPPYDWGGMDIPYQPSPNVTHSSADKFLQLPPSEISMIDYGRQLEVDNFYKACQMHRDQYKDNTGTLHPLDYFKPADYDFQCPSDPTSKYIKYPEYYVEYKKPQVFPLTLERSYPSPLLPHRALTGVYNPSSDIAYKR